MLLTALIVSACYIQAFKNAESCISEIANFFQAFSKTAEVAGYIHCINYFVSNGGVVFGTLHLISDTILSVITNYAQ